MRRKVARTAGLQGNAARLYIVTSPRSLSRPNARNARRTDLGRALLRPISTTIRTTLSTKKRMRRMTSYKHVPAYRIVTSGCGFCPAWPRPRMFAFIAGSSLCPAWDSQIPAPESAVPNDPSLPQAPRPTAPPRSCAASEDSPAPVDQ